jgi:hypothetical protein
VFVKDTTIMTNSFTTNMKSTSTITVSGSVGQFTKWLRNTDLNNPYNWDRGNLPCGNDRMILPDDGPVVFMQLNTTIQELVSRRFLSSELVE